MQFGAFQRSAGPFGERRGKWTPPARIQQHVALPLLPCLIQVPVVGLWLTLSLSVRRAEADSVYKRPACDSSNSACRNQAIRIGSASCIEARASVRIFDSFTTGDLTSSPNSEVLPAMAQQPYCKFTERQHKRKQLTGSIPVGIAKKTVACAVARTPKLCRRGTGK